MRTDDVIRALIQGLDGAAVVTVRVDWLRDMLDRQMGKTPESDVEVDLRAPEVGKILNRDASTVRLWCRAGLLPGAYRLLGREWRVPRSAIAKFQRQQRHM